MHNHYKQLFQALIRCGLMLVLALSIRACALHTERYTCLCMLLTEEHKVYQIDDRLFSVIDPAMLNPGTFTRINTHCPHHVPVFLTIYIDEGWFSGQIVK